jgi:hypothetical protein
VVDRQVDEGLRLTAHGLVVRRDSQAVPLASPVESREFRPRSFYLTLSQCLLMGDAHHPCSLVASTIRPPPTANQCTVDHRSVHTEPPEITESTDDERNNSTCTPAKGG